MWGLGGARAFDLTSLLVFLEVSVFCEFILGFLKEQFGKTCFSDGQNRDDARLLVFWQSYEFEQNVRAYVTLMREHCTPTAHIHIHVMWIWAVGVQRSFINEYNICSYIFFKFILSENQQSWSHYFQNMYLINFKANLKKNKQIKNIASWTN